MTIEPRINNAGTTTREEFGSTELATMAETSSTAVAAQARAQIEARYVMALKRPRDWDDVRVKLLKECKRPSFAQVAIYHKPIGKGIEGPSIRLAETAMRCMGNILAEAATVYDDAQKRIVRVTVTDLESNLAYPKDITVDKTVERSAPKDGQQILGVRTNSQGKKTYLVSATDDDLLNKENALISKAIRTNGLRLVPGDLVDEALWQVRQTLAKADAEDPDAARNRIVDGFASISVLPSDLKAYLDHDIGTASPAELNTLRGLFAAIRDGETTWPAAMEGKLAKAEKPAAVVSDKLKEKLEESLRKNDKKGEQPKADAAQESTAEAKAAPKGPGTAEFVKSPEAWAAHVAAFEDPHKLALDWNDRSAAFVRANVKDARRAVVLERLRALAPDTEPEAILAGVS